MYAIVRTLLAGMRQAVGDKLRGGMTRLDLLFIISAVWFVGSCCAATNLLKAKNNRAVMPPFNRCSSGSISAASRDQLLASAIQTVWFAGSWFASCRQSAARELSSNWLIIGPPCQKLDVRGENSALPAASLQLPSRPSYRRACH